MKASMVSIVINVYNARNDLKENLDSIFAQDYKNFEVIVVDNASKDGSPEYVEQNYPCVKLIKTDMDNGYAKGNNIGINEAIGSIICVMCPDTVVKPNFISECVRALDKKDIGMSVAKVKYYGTNKIWYAGANIYTGINLLKQFTVKVTSHIGKGEEDVGQYDEFKETDYASGVAFFIKKEVINKIGLFDERYFMYSEDADLSIRARRANYKIIYVPKTTIFHKINDDVKLSKDILRYWWYSHSTFKFVMKNFTLVDKMIWILKLPLNIVVEIVVLLNRMIKKVVCV